MKKISILDCTLRDGLRIIDCNISNKKIKNIALGLTNSKIDIVEMGFLRDIRKTEYKGNSTFFTQVSQITPFIPFNRGDTLFTAFVDFGMFDFDSLEQHTEDAIDAIRLGFTKKDFDENFSEVISCMNLVKTKGYKLLVQGVNSLGYNDIEFLQLIKVINEIDPFAFAIVDTYGAMYEEDLLHYFSLADYNLRDDIIIDFHSHNNYQLSFALSQKLINICDNRNIIIDCTLNGVGKVAGNLNTELIINYLNRKHGTNYDEDLLLDLIDLYTYSLKQEHQWGYSIPAFLAGEFKSHPNNIIYLTEKFRLDTKDIKYLLSMIDEKKRQRYDYDNIERLYVEYNSSKVDDNASIQALSEQINENTNILVIGPGNSILEYRDQILDYINKNNPIVISVNFIPENIPIDYVFYGSNKRYFESKEKRDTNIAKVIATSNINVETKKDVVINYSKVIEVGYIHFDNSTIMLLNLLKRLLVKNITIAGIDGFEKGKLNYCSPDLDYRRDTEKYQELNEETEAMLRHYKLQNLDRIHISFLTPSVYKKIFLDDERN